VADRLQPALLFDMIARVLPGELKPRILVVGSLAAAYRFRDQIHHDGITTKDADCVIHPAGVVDECRRIAERLLAAGWRRTDKCYPQERAEPRNALRTIRLYPPGTDAFFLEMLAFPDAGQREAMTWIPFRLSDGWYGLPSFRFLGLAEHGWLETENGLHYAAPEMMVLANLLAHPRLGTATMSEPIGGRVLLRSAKDLGRVLALAWLTGRDGTETWTPSWEEALRGRFGAEAGTLAEVAGYGLRELLDDGDALEQARHAVDVGLLAGKDITVDQLRASGQRLLADVLVPLVTRFGMGAA
jgi:hypothetical protein